MNNEATFLMKKSSFLFFLTMFLIGTDTFLISPLLPVLTETYKIPAAISGWPSSRWPHFSAAGQQVPGQ
ncbi:hypothetical protein [Sporolactobacillus vineae]|uniref:hypothetical protein n=1 Tax=Sporolactobacillus vineae TaxID=444463 RepID=UPI000288FDAD|nr:hypothetical protein [Sporolactobacillus vineae]